ncbi:MAG: hypothetical protein WC346_08670 [Methanogenium sp.]|jgi:hypothetical protein
MKQIKVTLANRIYIPTLFPEFGNFETAIIINDIRNKLKITQEELLNCEIETIEDISGSKTISWKKSKIIEIEFTDLEFEFLVELFKEKNVNKELKLDFDTLNFYSQLMFGKELS